VIRGVHLLQFAADSPAARAFFRDVLGLPSVDDGDGWLIFGLPPTELGFHPAGDGTSGGGLQLYLMCDDIESTVQELRAKGVTFTSAVREAGFGRLTSLQVPGAGEIGLYEPKHRVAIDLPPAGAPE